jgi:hypothetical protein
MKLAIYSDLHCEFERIQNQLLLLIMHPERYYRDETLPSALGAWSFA